MSKINLKAKGQTSTCIYSTGLAWNATKREDDGCWVIGYLNSYTDASYIQVTVRTSKKKAVAFIREQDDVLSAARKASLGI